MWAVSIPSVSTALMNAAVVLYYLHSVKMKVLEIGDMSGDVRRAWITLCTLKVNRMVFSINFLDIKSPEESLFINYKEYLLYLKGRLDNTSSKKG